jgi:anti-sigma factor RsiW
MRCEAVRDALPELARGTLEPDEAAAIREHIATCDACGEAWSVIGTLSAAQVTAPPALAARVTDELARRRAAGSLRGRVPTPVRWMAGAGVAVAAVIALILAWPEGNDAERALDMLPVAEADDPFLDQELFGATTPSEAELDGMIRVALNDSAGMLDDVVLVTDDAADAGLPPLALDLGSPAGDWPGADGMTAGIAMTDDLTYEQLELLLTEMES